jgi:hypothetical protein
MTTLDLLQKQIDGVGLQISAVFNGLDDSQADIKAAPHMMSPRETSIHLAECYEASEKAARGEEHSWGTYQPAGTGLTELVAEMKSKREAAVQAISGAEPDKAVHAATDYIILHDAYHVGQMCANRLAVDPEWNAYSIYGM